jgi:hypothetical protein
MYATVKHGGSACNAMSGGRKSRRRGTKRRGTKRRGTKRRGTKRRGTKRRGGMNCTKGGKKRKSSKTLFQRLGL